MLVVRSIIFRYDLLYLEIDSLKPFLVLRQPYINIAGVVASNRFLPVL